jgi:transcriptional regulator with XRE-family HTH domain
MSQPTTGNTVSRLLLGRRLKTLREHKAIHSEDAAAEAGVARATLWRMEKGDNRCRYKPGDVELLARLYDADKTTIDSLIHLAKTTRARTWVGAYRHLLTDSQETSIDLEAYATRIRCYAHAVLPDLLQTTDYATAQIGSAPQISNTDVRQHAQIRVHRRHILDRAPQPTRFEFILDEAALRRIIGRPGVMQAQLHALMALANQPHVTIQVVPYRTGMYPGLDTGPFTILDFPTDDLFGSLPTTVHHHRTGEHILLDKPKDVTSYQEHWDDLRAYALDRPTSLRLIAETAEQLTHR